MSVSAGSINRERLLFRFNEMRPLLVALANEKICRDIQAKVGASDIVQQTMLEAYQHVHTLEPADDRHIFNWLSKILFNNLRDVSKSFRQAKKRSVEKERRFRSDGNIPDKKCFTKLLEQQEDLELLRKALNCLPLSHQQILVWVFYDQMTYPQISALVGRSDDAVRMLVKRAIHRLAREMHVHDHSSVN
jgi:RNA polymerase sigma-70 factor (ECF subfamily)